MTKNGSAFLLALLVSVFNIALAILYSRNGYEAFVTVSVALGILFTLLTINTLRLTFKSKGWLIAKLLSIPLLAFIWFVVVAEVMLTISKDAYGPSVNTPNVNWRLILTGSVPYMLPRLNTLRSNSSLKYLFLSMLVTVYSVVVLLIASIDFKTSDSLSHNIILVLAIELLYLMNFAVLKTNYIDKSLTFSNNLVTKLRLVGSDFGSYIIIAIVGLPFFIPLASVIALSFIKN